MSEPRPPRERCYRCWRPAALCLCQGLPSVPTRTRVVILQHAHEHRHPFGSARLVRLCLPNAELHVVHGGLRNDLHRPLELPPDTAVLYPHPDAADLAELPPAERPGTLLVLDGTWAHSRRLYRANPWLQGLRHVRLHPREPSRYRIRREPQADYVSTLEATVQALRLLEPEHPGIEQLLAVFDGMIDRQIQVLQGAVRHGRRKQPRQREDKRLPALLDDPRLCVVYAESWLPGGDPSATRELAQLVLAPIDGGPPLEVLVRPSGAFPTGHHLECMRVPAALLAAGADAAAARERIASWLPAGAPLCAWTQSSLDWARPLLPDTSPTFVLKSGYCNVRHRRAGFLEELLAREGLQPVPVACHGRAQERLGNALAAARWLRDQRRRQVAGAPVPSAE